MNGVLIDNSGSGYGSSKKPGGLIVGVANGGDGVAATQVNGRRHDRQLGHAQR
ncbi:MAG: hypothetical protein WDM84_08990 [Bauldia sp.]